MPIQNASPTSAALRWSTPSWITIFIPCTNSTPMKTVIYAAATGVGLAIRSAVNLGKNATMMNTRPITTPTRLAATPVISAREMLDE